MTAYMIFWLVAFIVFAIVEAASTQLVSVWFALGSLVAFITALFDFDFWVQVTIFIVVATILIILTRPLAKKLWKHKFIPTNADSIIGQIGLVMENIDNFANEGRVAVEGLDWSARTDDGSKLEKGTAVVIKKIEGVKLIVHIATPEDYTTDAVD